MAFSDFTELGCNIAFLVRGPSRFQANPALTCRHPHSKNGLTAVAWRKYGYRVDEVPRVSQDSLPGSAPHQPKGVDAVKLHITLLVGIALCAAAFWFELRRAEGGNTLSWAYVFEWPLLALFGIYMWWNFLHGGTTRLRRKRADKVTIAPEYSGMLAAWQQYQRELIATQNLPTSESDGDATPDTQT